MSKIEISMTVTHIDSNGDSMTVERSTTRDPMNDNPYRRRNDVDHYIDEFLMRDFIPMLDTFGKAV